ncbi:hypothetical protein H311_01961, partial [Anncaliia algerae PRA109]
AESEERNSLEEVINRLERSLKLGSERGKFTSYDGSRRGEVAAIWFEQFEPYWYGWEDKTALSFMKANLSGVARLWLIGAIDNEIKNKEDFQKEFRIRFMKMDQCFTSEMFKYIHQGTKPENFLKYALKIRTMHKRCSKISLEDIIQTIKSQSSNWIRRELESIKRWLDFINKAEEISAIAKEWFTRVEIR